MDSDKDLFDFLPGTVMLRLNVRIMRAERTREAEIFSKHQCKSILFMCVCVCVRLAACVCWSIKRVAPNGNGS